MMEEVEDGEETKEKKEDGEEDGEEEDRHFCKNIL